MIAKREREFQAYVAPKWRRLQLLAVLHHNKNVKPVLACSRRRTRVSGPVSRLAHH
jgi:hypothetical protein